MTLARFMHSAKTFQSVAPMLLDLANTPNHPLALASGRIAFQPKTCLQMYSKRKSKLGRPLSQKQTALCASVCERQ